MKKENELINEEKTCDCEEQELFTAEDITSLLEEVMPKVDINLDNVKDITMDKKAFKNGIDSVSYICGQYSALKNVGIEGSSCIDIIISLLNAYHNMKMQESTCKNNIEISKIQQVQMEKAQL